MIESSSKIINLNTAIAELNFKCMKPKSLTPLLFATLFLFVTIGLVSWNVKQTGKHYQFPVNDTTPKGKKPTTEKKIRDLDDVLDQLDNAEVQLKMEKAEKEMAEAMKKFDAEKLKMDLEKVMKEIDMAKLKKEMDESMAKIDMYKVKLQMEKAMKELDVDKMKQSMEKVDLKKAQEKLQMAMKEMDAAKLKQEIELSMNKVDWDKMKTQMEDLKKMKLEKMDIDLKSLKENLEKIQPELKERMEKAKESVEKAKAEMKEYKSFVEGLNADGLIDKKGEYTIKHKDGELIINGKKVSNEVYSKYRSFLERHKKFNIEKSDDNFNIDID